MNKIISDEAITKRRHWIDEIQRLSGSFGVDTLRLEAELKAELQSDGISTLCDHLRLCGNIPESYGHDTSEEKLYSKYTDYLLSLTFNNLGFSSNVLSARGDSADVEAFADDYSFVADAKAFRLSRTAKNQKDFKVQAMHGWKRSKNFAMIVCPIYQLPTSSSQIYEQATTQKVCIFTYSHLVLLLNFSISEGNARAQELLLDIFHTVESLKNSKSATEYWQAINNRMLNFSGSISELWESEKGVAAESIEIAKEEAIAYLEMEKHRISLMSHNDALTELIKIYKFESKLSTINAISDNELFTLK